MQLFKAVGLLDQETDLARLRSDLRYKWDSEYTKRPWEIIPGIFFPPREPTSKSQVLRVLLGARPDILEESFKLLLSSICSSRRRPSGLAGRNIAEAITITLRDCITDMDFEMATDIARDRGHSTLARLSGVMANAGYSLASRCLQHSSTLMGDLDIGERTFLALAAVVDMSGGPDG